MVPVAIIQEYKSIESMLERNDWQLTEGIKHSVNKGHFRRVKASIV